MLSSYLQILRRPALRYALWIPFSILGVACASTEKVAEPTTILPVKTHFVLENGLKVEAEPPFPDMTPIYAQFYADQIKLERRLAYKAWDLDKDGKMDMLEYFGEDGKLVRRAFDFDKDGRVDLDQLERP